MCWQVCGWKNTYCWKEGSGPEVEVLVQSAIAEHIGQPCADTRRMLVALVDIRTLVPTLNSGGHIRPLWRWQRPRAGKTTLQTNAADEQGKPPNAQFVRAPDVHPAKREGSTSGSDVLPEAGRGAERKP